MKRLSLLVFLLAGCDRIPCEIAPGFPYCVGEVRQTNKPIVWNRTPTCARKGGVLRCVK